MAKYEYSDILLDFAGYAFPVEGAGPGRRVSIWVRGCQAQCAGCIAPDLWEPGTPTPLGDIVHSLLPYLPKADGLTISGGEPFNQPGALAALIDLLRQEIDIEVLVYTGYRREELEARGGDTAALLARIDILIDGLFLQDAPNTLLWRGSDNQRVHLLTARARERYADVKDAPMPDVRPLQIQMLASDQFRIIGIPRRGELDVMLTALAARGVEVKPDHG